MAYNIDNVRKNIEASMKGRYRRQGDNEIVSGTEEAAHIPILNRISNWSMQAHKYLLGEDGAYQMADLLNEDPTMRIVRATGVTNVSLYDDDGNILPFSALENYGLKIEQPTHNQTGKRLSRLFRRSTAFGTYTMGKMPFAEFGDENTTDPWDGANLISREALQVLTQGLDARTRKKIMQTGRFSGTVMAGGQYGGYQYKGDWLVRDLEDMPDMPDQPGVKAMIASPYGSAKKQISYNPFSNSVFVEMRPQVAHTQGNIDVQSLINWGHPLIKNEQFQGWLQLQSDEFMQSLKEGKGSEMALKMYSGIASEDQWESRMKDPLYRYLSSGGRLEDSPTMIRKFAEMRTKSLIGKNYEGMRLPVQGLFRLYMSNAATSDREEIRNLGPGQSYADVENATFYINSQDYMGYEKKDEGGILQKIMGLAQKLGGGDQDDALNILLNKTGQVMVARTPNASGEYGVLNLVNADEMKKHGIHGIDADFEKLSKVTQIHEKNAPDREGRKGKPPSWVRTFKEYAEWQMQEAAKNITILGRHINVLAATTLLTGRETPDQPAKLENVIDDAQKNIGSDLSDVEAWDQATATRLKGYPLPRLGVERIKGFFKNPQRQFMVSKGHWIDELFGWADRHIDKFIKETEALANQASMPIEALNNLTGTALGEGLSQQYFNALNEGRTADASGKQKELADSDYERARMSTVQYLQSMPEKDAYQSILQAMYAPLSSGGRVNDRFLWSGRSDEPEGDISSWTFRALEHYGVLRHAEYESTPLDYEPVGGTRTMTLMATGSELYAANMGREKTFANWNSVNVQARSQALKRMRETPEVFQGISFSVQDGALLDESGQRIGNIAPEHWGGLSNLQSGKIGRATYKNGRMVFSVTDFQYAQEDIGEVDEERMALAGNDLYAFADKVAAGEETLEGLPAHYRSAIRNIQAEPKRAYSPDERRSIQAVNDPSGFYRSLKGGRETLEGLETSAKYLITTLAQKMGANLAPVERPPTEDFSDEGLASRNFKDKRAKAQVNANAIKAANYLTVRQMTLPQENVGRFSPSDYGELWKTAYFAAQHEDDFFDREMPEMFVSDTGNREITRTFAPEEDIREIAPERAYKHAEFLNTYWQKNPSFMKKFWGFKAKANAPDDWRYASDPAERWPNTPDNANPFFGDYSFSDSFSYAGGGGLSGPPPIPPNIPPGEPPEEPEDFDPLEPAGLGYDVHPQFIRAYQRARAGQNTLYIGPTASGKSDLIRSIFRNSGGINIMAVPAHSLASAQTDKFNAKYAKEQQDNLRDTGTAYSTLGRTFYLRGHPGAYAEGMDKDRWEKEVADYETSHSEFYNYLWGRARAERTRSGRVERVTGWQGQEPVNVVMTYEKLANLQDTLLGRTLKQFGDAGLIKNVAIDEAQEITTTSRHSGRYLYEGIRSIAPSATITATSATLSEMESVGLQKYLRADEINRVEWELHPEMKFRVLTDYKRKDYDKAISKLYEESGRRSTLVFAPSVDETIKIAGKMRDQNIDAVYYHRDPSRKLTDEEEQEAMTRLGETIGPGQMTISTQAAKVGLHNPQLESVIVASRGRLHDLVQMMGRLRTDPGSLEAREGYAGEATILADPSHYYQGAANVERAVEKLPQYITQAFMDARNRQGEFSRNWRVAAREIQSSVEDTLRNYRELGDDKGIYPYFASDVTSMLSEAGLINLGGDELEWSFSNDTYESAYNRITGAKFKNPIGPSEAVSFNDYRQGLMRTSREYKLLGRLFDSFQGIDPEQAGKEFFAFAKRFYSFRAKAEAPDGHEKMGLVVSSGTDRKVMDLDGWSHPKSFEAYPTSMAKAIANSMLDGRQPVGTVHSEPAGTPDHMSVADHDLPGETFIQKEGNTPKRMKAAADDPRDPHQDAEDFFTNDQPAMRMEKASERLVKIFEELAQNSDRLNEHFGKFSKQVEEVNSNIGNMPQVKAAVADSLVQKGLQALPRSGAIGDAYLYAAGVINPQQGGGAGGQGAGGGGGQGGGGSFSEYAPMRSPLSRALYGLYMARRMWQYTAAESFQNAYYASQPGMGLALGAPESELYGGYSAREGQAREAQGRAVLDTFGGLMDMGHMASRNPYIAQAGVGLQVGAGLGFGAIELGMNLSQSAYFMAQSDDASIVKAGKSLQSLGSAMTTGGMIIGGGIAAANAGMALSNWYFDQEGRESWSVGNIPRNAAYNKAIYDAANAKHGYDPRRRFVSAISGMMTIGPHAYGIMGDLAEAYDVTYEDMQEYSPEMTRLAQVVDRTEEQKRMRTSANNLVDVFGGQSDDYMPILTALGRGTKRGIMGNTPLAERMLSAGGKIGYAPQEYASDFLTTMKQLGVRPGSDEYVKFEEAYADFGEREDYQGLYQMQVRGEKVGQLAGQLSPYLGYDEAAQFVRRSGINTQAQARGMAQILDTYQTYGGQKATIDQLGKFVTGYSAPVLAGAQDLASSFLQQGGSADGYLGVLGAVAGVFQNRGYSPQQMSMASAIMGGNLQAASYASYNQPGLLSDLGMSGTRFFDRSMNPIFETSGRDFIALLRDQASKGLTSAQAATGYTSLFGGASLSDEGIASYLGVRPSRMNAYMNDGVRGVERSIREDLYQNSVAGIGLQREQLGEQRSYTYQMWGYEDQLKALSHRSQMASFDATQTRMVTQNQFAIQQEGISWDRMQANHDYQRWQLGQEKEGNLLQRQWQRQDWAYQDQVRGLQWTWKQEDFGEEVRFMTGRQRRLAERQMRRDTIMHNLEGDQIETQRGRQEQVWKKEDERHTKQVEYAEKLMALDVKQFELNQSQRETYYEMEMDEFNRRKDEYLEEKKIRDEIQKAERAHQEKNFEFQTRSIELSERNMELQKELEEVGRKSAQVFGDLRGELEAINEFDNPRVILEAVQAMLSASGNVDPAVIDSITSMIKGLGGSKTAAPTQGYQYSYEPNSNLNINNFSNKIPPTINVYIGNEKLEKFVIDVVEGEMK